MSAKSSINVSATIFCLKLLTAGHMGWEDPQRMSIIYQQATCYDHLKFQGIKEDFLVSPSQNMIETDVIQVHLCKSLSHAL